MPSARAPWRARPVASTTRWGGRPARARRRGQRLGSESQFRSRAVAVAPARAGPGRARGARRRRRLRQARPRRSAGAERCRRTGNTAGAKRANVTLTRSPGDQMNETPGLTRLKVAVSSSTPSRRRIGNGRRDQRFPHEQFGTAAVVEERDVDALTGQQDAPAQTPRAPPRRWPRAEVRARGCRRSWRLPIHPMPLAEHLDDRARPRPHSPRPPATRRPRCCAARTG